MNDTDEIELTEADMLPLEDADVAEILRAMDPFQGAL